MRFKLLHIIIFALGLQFNLQAQLSPGDLTTAHAELEGIRNCTQCHTLGSKIDDSKCLDCHKEIKSRVDQRTGYHASREVRDKNCASCHSEHHGRKFDMVRFDEDNFDHDLTGYELEGAHQKIDCRQCHIPDFIDDRDLRKRKDTYLGLSQDCIDCHEDYHQNTLASNDCATCHSVDAFAPADYFDHDDTKYPLRGKHVDVECIECHQKETRNGKDFQRFADVEFANCISCHDDVHDNNLGTNCKQCHSENSFTSLRKIKRFNHNKTGFPLNGAHRQINCADCHNMEAPLTTIFQDKNGIKTNDCIACHEDVHDNKLGSNCVECHNEDSFFSVSTDEFDHNKTDFTLRGKHQAVDCRECHTESLTAPLAHNTCAACHTDYHEGEFAVQGKSPDCAECHTEDGFEGSLYTIEDHNKSSFPLEGAHIATPCFACHLQEDKWRFKQIGEQCVDCHDDVHEGYIAAEFYPEQACTNCHIADDWVSIQFDHNLTDFKLQGKHTEASCMDCHGVDEASAANRYEGFANTPTECADCHDNVHDQQFEQNGITDCARCHGFESWGVENFNHDNTAFKLDGAHAEVACEACHKPTVSEGRTIIQYKFNSFECIDCHQ